MNVFSRSSRLTPREWAIVIWFFASLGYLVWIRFRAPKVPVWWRIACVLNCLAALVVYQTVLW